MEAGFKGGGGGERVWVGTKPFWGPVCDVEAGFGVGEGCVTSRLGLCSGGVYSIHAQP